MQPNRNPDFLVRRMQHGASLIEVLIAVLVVAIGLLGVAALQASALRNSQSAYERTQATIMSYSLLDAMRADLAATRNGDYNTTGFLCAAPTGTTLHDVQMIDWINTLQSGSGLGTGACGQIACGVSVNPTDPTSCTIDVRWDDTRGDRGVSNQTIRTVTML